MTDRIEELAQMAYEATKKSIAHVLLARAKEMNNEQF